MRVFFFGLTPHQRPASPHECLCKQPGRSGPSGRRWEAVGAGLGLLRVFLRVCCLFMSAAVLTHSTRRMGIVTAKLRPKEDSELRVTFRSSAFVQTAFCQEGFQGEEELEPALKVESPQAIVAAPCQVEFGRMSAGLPESQ